MSHLVLKLTCSTTKLIIFFLGGAQWIYVRGQQQWNDYFSSKIENSGKHDSYRITLCLLYLAL